MAVKGSMASGTGVVVSRRVCNVVEDQEMPEST